MWDPDYRNYIIWVAAERGMELPPHFLGEEEEEGQEEEEDEDEEEEEDNGDGDDDDDDVGEGSGTTPRQVLYGSRENNVSAVALTGSSRGAVNLVQASEDDVIVVGARESGSQGMDTNDGKMGGIIKRNDDGEHQGELNRGEIDGLFCPICLEAWSSGGDHHVCCLPCGHIYGLSCIKKWLTRPGCSKCPQCKKKCGMKGIRLLYATQIVAVDGELQKKVQSLETKCTKLEKEKANSSKKEVEWMKKEAEMHKQVHHLKERIHGLEGLLEDMEHRVSGSSPTNLNCPGQSTSDLDAFPKFQMQGCLRKFIMQKEYQVTGARLFDTDFSSLIFVIARRLSGFGGAHLLTKVSLSSDHEKEDIRLPDNIRAVKDLKVAPHARLVLLASLGKKLSVLSTASNNTVLTYDLPTAAWSCSWDVSSPHYVYAGLQNGSVLQFDTRQTTRHVQSLTGLTCNPVHTLHTLPYDSSFGSGIRAVLSASSLGLCQWNFGGDGERPYLIPESDKRGVCISLAYCRSSDDIVASYRPKIQTPDVMEITQPTLATSGQVARGSHVLYRKMGCTYQRLGTTCANVSDIRLPKSTIIDGVYRNPAFASGDELTNGLMLQELPSLMVVDYLKPQKPPIRDIKFTRSMTSGLLGCLSEDAIGLFTAELL